jgi:hypothetical protein
MMGEHQPKLYTDGKSETNCQVIFTIILPNDEPCSFWVFTFHVFWFVSLASVLMVTVLSFDKTL